MIKFRLDRIDDREAVYTFFPEGDVSAPGKASILRASGDVTVLEESTADPCRIYLGHMFSKLREMNEAGNFEQSGMVAWW